MPQDHDSKPARRRLYTIPEAAEELRVHVRTINRMKSAGELAWVQIGRRVLIPGDSIDACIERHRSDKPS